MSPEDQTPIDPIEAALLQPLDYLYCESNEHLTNNRHHAGDGMWLVMLHAPCGGEPTVRCDKFVRTIWDEPGMQCATCRGFFTPDTYMSIIGLAIPAPLVDN